MVRVLCACRRPHFFLARPGLHQAQTCACRRLVTYQAPVPSRWTLLEID